MEFNLQRDCMEPRRGRGRRGGCSGKKGSDEEARHDVVNLRVAASAAVMAVAKGRGKAGTSYASMMRWNSAVAVFCSASDSPGHRARGEVTRRHHCAILFNGEP